MNKLSILAQQVYNEFVYRNNSFVDVGDLRQIGKTSAMLELANSFVDQGYYTIFIARSVNEAKRIRTTNRNSNVIFHGCEFDFNKLRGLEDIVLIFDEPTDKFIEDYFENKFWIDNRVKFVGGFINSCNKFFRRTQKNLPS